MEDAAEPDIPIRERVAGALRGKRADSHHPSGFQDIDQPAQVYVTGGE